MIGQQNMYVPRGRFNVFVALNEKDTVAGFSWIESTSSKWMPKFIIHYIVFVWLEHRCGDYFSAAIAAVWYPNIFLWHNLVVVLHCYSCCFHVCICVCMSKSKEFMMSDTLDYSCVSPTTILLQRVAKITCAFS